MWPEKLISVVAVDLLVKCKYSQISNTHTCTLTHHTNFNNVLYQFQIDLKAMCIRKKKTHNAGLFFTSSKQNWCQLSQELFDTSMYEGQVLRGCDDGAFTVFMVHYTSVAQFQGRVFHRDFGLERRHSVFSLYSRETEECSLFIFIHMKLELTECYKWFLEIGIFFLL